MTNAIDAAEARRRDIEPTLRWAAGQAAANLAEQLDLPAGLSVRFDTERDQRYTMGEGGVVRPTAPSAHGSALAGPISDSGQAVVRHRLRCQCEPCLNDREIARYAALLDLAGEKPSWASRSWDGPLAQFPGTVSNDTGRPVRVRKAK